MTTKTRELTDAENLLNAALACPPGIASDFFMRAAAKLELEQYNAKRTP